MRLSTVARHMGGAVSCVALLAGCAGNTAGVAPSAAAHPASEVRQSLAHYRPMRSPNGALSVLPAGFERNTARPSWMKLAPAGTMHDREIVAEFGNSNIFSFRKYDRSDAPPAICEPASSTNGIGVDAAGDLWIPDGRADSTTEYGPNCGPALLTIPDPTGEPADVGFDSKGHVYILNINDTSGPPTVGIYTSQGAQLGTLSDPSFAVLFGIGTDDHDNIFVSNLTSDNVGNIVEFPHGAMPGKALAGVHLGLPGSPVFDAANNLIITDWEAETIDVFAPPYGSPPKTTPLMGFSIWCPLGHDRKRLYCGDAENGSIDVYDYPGGAYEFSYSNSLSPDDLVTGSAPIPAAPL